MNCSKCHGSYEKEGRDPLLLPYCGHSACRPCLRLFTQHKGFQCPACGKKQPKVNLSDLLPNFALLEIIEAKNEEKGRNGKKKERHRSGVRTGTPREEDQDRDESLKRTCRETERGCVDHEGVRLSYWCGPCGVVVCGECVVEGHLGGGGGGGRRHEALRIEAAVKERRSELEDLVLEVLRALDIAEENHTVNSKTSPFVTSARRLQVEVGAVMGKMRIVASLLACLIQGSEDRDAGLRQLRKDLDTLIQKAPVMTSAAGNVAEIRALLEHLKSIEGFRDGPMAKVLKEIVALSQEDHQSFLSTASGQTAILNHRAVALCKQVVSYGDGCRLEVTGCGGTVGSLTREQDKLHLHHLSPGHGYSHDSARRNALKWSMVQTQMHEVTQVFLAVSWVAHGSQAGTGTGTGTEQVYFKLHQPDSTTSTSVTARRRFLHLVMGDDNGDEGKNSLLGPLVVQVAAGRGILLGTHHLREGQGGEDKGDGATGQAEGNASSPDIVSAGDVICVTGQQREGQTKGDLEFWLVMEGVTRTAKLFAGCQVVGALLPAHTSWLAKLPSLRGVKVVDCGAVICSQPAARTIPIDWFDHS